jgi:adhesin/invasin
VFANGTQLTGYPVVGDQLSANIVCSDGACPNGLTYQWQIETAPGSGVYQDIPGATAATWVVTKDQQKSRIRVRVATPSNA